MEEFIIEYWLQALFGLMVAVLGVAYKRMDKKISEQEAIKNGLQALLRDRIIQAYNHYMDKGYCPIYALENIERLYTEYRALGGNGTVSTLVENLRQLTTECKGAIGHEN